MEKKINLQEKNKKRAAFKRFSQMGVTGLAVVSMSAFTDVSAKQLPANGATDFTKEQSSSLTVLTGNFYATDEVAWAVDYGGYYPNYSNYTVYSEYSNYGGGGYSNNYTDQC